MSNSRTRLRTDDLLIPQGATWRVQFPLVHADGTPFNPLGCSARCQFRERTEAVSALANFTSDNGAITLTTGALTLRVDASVSSAMTVLQGRYDIEMVLASEEIVRITQGSWAIDPEVTR